MYPGAQTLKLTCSCCGLVSIIASGLHVTDENKYSIASRCGWRNVPRVLCPRCRNDSPIAVCSVCGLLQRISYINDVVSFNDKIKKLLELQWLVVPKIKCNKCKML